MKDRVLFLNRRDLKNPMGGGAELYTHRIASGLARRGLETVIYSCRFPGAPASETIDGVLYIRGGNELTVHARGFFHALANRKKYSVIIDEFNGAGFFGFLIPGSVLLIYQLYREFWMKELGAAGIFFNFIEPLMLKLYRGGRTVITISESTRRDLESLKFEREKIKLVLVGMDIVPLKEVPAKEAPPTLLFLGRLRSTKQPEKAIAIFRMLKQEKKIPGLRLRIAGIGPEERRLKEIAAGEPDIIFHGHVSEEEKIELLKGARVLVVPSVREGFGINVVEAASQGTPAVGFDVPGLRDSIKDGVTGYLAGSNEIAAEKIFLLLDDPALYNRMAAACLDYAGDFNWEHRSDEFLKAIFKGTPSP